MKKFILGFLFLFLFPLSTFAASLSIDKVFQFDQNEIGTLAPLKLTAEASNEINSAHGIALTLPTGPKALWQKPQQLTLSGSAVDSGHIAASLEPTFSADMRTLYLPVLADFSNGEQVIVNGLQIRTYSEKVTAGYLDLDLTGDGLLEKKLDSAFEVDDMDHKDIIAPYAPTAITATPDFNQGQLRLSWVKPPDYDLFYVSVQKASVLNGQTEPFGIVFQAFSDTEFIDKNLKEGDRVIYRVYAHDQNNQSLPAEITVDFTPPAPEPAPVEPQPETPPVTPEPTPPQEPTPNTPDLSTSGYTDIAANDWFFKAVVYGEKEAKYFDAAEKFNPQTESNRAQYSKLLATFVDSQVDFALPQSAYFKDVSLAHWAAKPIYFLFERGIMLGYQDAKGTLTGFFGPENNITREQAFAGLVRALKLPIESTENEPFTDVTSEDWSYPLIVTAYKNGLTQGQTPTFFNKNAPITRAELAQLFYNAAQWKLKQVATQ